jgi:hypothetical protein
VFFVGFCFVDKEKDQWKIPVNLPIGLKLPGF